MNANTMAGFWALVWLALSVYSIASAKPIKWKFLNFLIIMAFMGLGLGIGAAFGAWGGNMEIGGHIAASLIFLLVLLEPLVVLGEITDVVRRQPLDRPRVLNSCRFSS